MSRLRSQILPGIVATLVAAGLLSAQSIAQIGTIPARAVSSLGGLGANVATALAVAVGSAGSFVVNGGALGTPSSGVATNLTGIPLRIMPGGRLTLLSGVPVQSGASVSGGTIYYDTYVHNQVPIYGGTTTDPLVIGSDEISLVLDATNHPIENVYDIFGISNTGTLTLVTGPAYINTATITVTIASPAVVTWTAHGLYDGAPVIFTTSGALPTGITAGTTYYVGRGAAANTFNISTSLANSNAGTFVNTSGTQSGTHTGTNHTTTRGTGAGTTELESKNGVWTNKNALTHAYNNSTDYGSIAANRATLLGTFYTTAAATTRMDPLATAASGGTNSFLALDNTYNQVPIFAVVRDTAADWTYNSTTFRGLNNSYSNRITWVASLATFYPDVDVNLQAQPSSAGNQAQVGVWFNVASGNPTCAWQQQRAVSMTNLHGRSPCGRTNVGVNFVQAAEQSSSGTSTFGEGGGGLGGLMVVLPR